MMTKKNRLLALLLAMIMVFTLTPIAIVSAADEVEINETNFPDATFREFVATKDSITKDGVLSADEIAKVTSITLPNKGITNLKGIEYFTKVTVLNCSKNKLTSLDVSNNTALKTLNCSENQLTSLEVENNKDLTSFNCSVNQLTALDVSQNEKLRTFNCSNNQLTKLNVSDKEALTTLTCNDNNLTELVVANNAKLTTLNFKNNNLTNVDVSTNTKLTAAKITADGNTREIMLKADNTFNLKDLPGFDDTKASGWKYATVDGTILTPNRGTEKATYVYDLGNGKTETFTLTYHFHFFGLVKYDETQHWKQCSYQCGLKIDFENHSFDEVKSNDTQHWKGCECGAGIEYEDHTSDGKFYASTSQHYKMCECGAKFDFESHRYGDWTGDDTQHWKECECGYKSSVAKHNYMQYYDETQHWKKCACGSIIEQGDHEFETVGAVDATIFDTGYTGDKVCKGCGYTITGEEIPAKGIKVDFDNIIGAIEDAFAGIELDIAVEDIIGQIKDLVSDIDPEDVKDVLEQIIDLLSKIDPEDIEGAANVAKDALDKIIDFVETLLASGDADVPTTDKPADDNMDSTTDSAVNGSTDDTVDGTTDDSNVNASTDDTSDGTTDDSELQVPDTGATAGIAAFAALSVAAAAAFVSKKKNL